MSERLFALEEVPEVPLFREPRRRKGEGDARFVNDYPPEWDQCGRCLGTAVVAKPGMAWTASTRETNTDPCPECLGMGSVKAMVRLLAGHRCERCRHPYVPKGDAAMLGVERSGMHDGVWTPWSACDKQCVHGGPLRWRGIGWQPGRFQECDDRGEGIGWFPEHGDWYHDALVPVEVEAVESAWRILTVHHLDGDKANLAWWNLASLCQRCHLEIQAKVVMQRVYPHEHSEWFRPHAAGYYARVYLGEDLSRDSVTKRLEELLALERVA